MSFLPVLDSWQWRLTAERPLSGPVPRRIGDFWLQVDDGLSVTSVTDVGGRSVGFLLGVAVDLEARTLLGSAWQARTVGNTDPDTLAISVLRSLGGRFLWISAPLGAPVHIYTDSSAQVPCVFDPEQGAAGSTAHALFDETTYQARFDRRLFDQLGIDGEGWFPAGLTAHRGLRRLLPGHCLDTATWKVRRVWPTTEVAETRDPAGVVTGVVDLVRTQIEAVIAGPKRLALALTAGHETRMLLACARPYLAHIDVVTVVGEDRHATDTVIARRIARDMGLRHIELPRTEASPEDRARFIRRGGHCNADSNARFHPSVAPIADTHMLFGGVGGEVARAFFWRPSDDAATHLDDRVLTGRMGLPRSTETDRDFASWLADLPVKNSLHALDLAYLEHRDGAWYGPQFYSDPHLLRLAPLLTLPGVELMLSLPPDWKRQSRLGHAIIAQEWPELLRYPFNSQGRLRDTLIRLQRVVTSPRLILKKLRKMRG